MANAVPRPHREPHGGTLVDPWELLVFAIQ